MAKDNDESRRNDERVGRGVKEGMNGGVSRNAHTQGESREASESAGRRGDAGSAGEGGYGGSSGYTGGTNASRDTGATSARTRPGDVGRQAESGIETDPDAGSRGSAAGTDGGARVTSDMRESDEGETRR